MLNEYLQYLQENKVITKNSNAPCAAYETVYGKKCPHTRGMHPNHLKRNWNGMEVDEHLEDKWLNDLNNIKGIEIRSSCEGHDKNWVAFVIFRFLTNRSDGESVKSKLEANDKITKCSYHIGRGGKMRYIVAAPIWYKHKDWNKWWSTIANRIKGSI